MACDHVGFWIYRLRDGTIASRDGIPLATQGTRTGATNAFRIYLTARGIDPTGGAAVPHYIIEGDRSEH